MVEPIEQAGVEAILAQQLAVAGRVEEAQAAMNRAVKQTQIGARHREQDPDSERYWPNVFGALPEVLAAVWILESPEAAVARGEAWAEVFANDEYQWRCATALYAAQAFRRAGEKGSAAALDAAVRTLEETSDSFAFETAWTLRELCVQGRPTEAIALAQRPGPAAFSTAKALGVAQGLRAIDNN